MSVLLESVCPDYDLYSPLWHPSIFLMTTFLFSVFCVSLNPVNSGVFHLSVRQKVQREEISFLHLEEDIGIKPKIVSLLWRMFWGYLWQGLWTLFHIDTLEHFPHIHYGVLKIMIVFTLEYFAPTAQKSF